MNTTPVTLLQRLRNPSDRVAWEQFVAIYAPLLGEYGRRLRLPEQDIEDLTQELMIVLLGYLPSFEYVQGGTFRGFLWRCYHRLALKLYKTRQVPWPEGLELASEDVPLMEQREFQEFVLARANRIMQSRFEEQVWKSYVGHHLEGRPAREVAESLGIPQANVWIYKSRVLAELRLELAGLLD